MGDSFKFFTDDWIVKTAHLSALERGVLITLMALHPRPLHRDLKRAARILGVPPKQADRALSDLEALGFIYRNGSDVYHVSLLEVWQETTGARRSAIPASVREEVWQRDGEVCRYCCSDVGPFHLDHVFPWSRGGGHTVENLVVACASCNLSKSDKTLDEMGWTL